MTRQYCLALFLLASGCAAAPDAPEPAGAPAPAPSTGSPSPEAGSTPPPGLDLDSGVLPSAPEAVGTLRGSVFAPNGSVPIAGALLYLTPVKPAPIPAQVYCDACVKLAPGTPYALSDAKGAFELAPVATGAQYLVVQKGGFRRVREIYVSKGELTLPATLTTLPPKTDTAAGDDVPRMTVVRGAYDEIEASLEKLGIAPEAIEIVHSPLIGVAAKAFLGDEQQLSGRHIVFLPCGDFTQPAPNVDLSADATIQENLRAFVGAGGRLYVTDWHYDFIARAFPGFVSFDGATSTACSGCGHLPYDAAAVIADTGLGAWMGAQGLSSFTLQKNYTSISSVQPVASVTPRVWVNGSKQNAPARPATVSFEHGCGRVLFSTYHTEPFSLELTPQERALLGVLLEVSVCNDSPEGVIVK